MADITAFPTIRNVLYSGNNINAYTAGVAITAGQLVAIHGTGVNMTVHPAKKGTTVIPIGVALYSISSGEEVAVAGDGCIVYVANADDTTAIDAGDPLEDNDNAVGGTVSIAVVSLAGAVALVQYLAGVALDDIAGGATGRMLVKGGYITAANTA